MDRDQFSRDATRRTGGGASGPFPGFGGAPPVVGPVSIAGATGLASDAGHTHGSDPGAATVATWSTTGLRVFALDPDGGNNANAGFVDATTASQADVAIAMTAAGLIAKKTWAGVLAIIPINGANRAFVVAIKPRAAGATIAENLIFKGFVGYRGYWFHATSDFSNTTTDMRRAGATNALTNPCMAPTAVGPNADGTWTVGAAYVLGSNVIPVAAGALPAADTLPGYRIRFVTCASAPTVDSCNNIKRNGAGTTTVTVGRTYTVLVVTPGDTFYIERAGVAFQAVQISLEGQTALTTPEMSGVARSGIKGIAATATGFRVDGPGKAFSFLFCEARGIAFICFNLGQGILQPENYRDFSGIAALAGSVLRADSGITMNSVATLSMDAFAALSATAVVSMTRVTSFDVGQGSYAAKGFELRACGQGGIAAAASTVEQCMIGNTNVAGAYSGLDINGAVATGAGILARRTSFSARQIVFENLGARPGITIDGTGGHVRLDDLSGTTGNTGYGLDLTDARNTFVAVGRDGPVTVTGTAGDILLHGPAVATWAGLARTNVIDDRTNRIQGSAGYVVAACILLSNQSGVALVVGDVCKPNGTSGQVTKGQADTIAKADGSCLVAVCGSAAAALGYFAVAETPDVNFDIAPTAGAIAYLHNAAAGLATTTVPAVSLTAAKLRLGRVLTVSGTTGRVAWKPEFVPVLGDGLA